MKSSGEQRAKPSGRRGIAALSVILAAGLLLRVGYLFSIWHAPDFASPVLDPQLNDYWARAIVTGNWAPPAHADDPEIATTPYGRPPGYPYFLAVVYRFLGLHYGAPRLVQTVLGMVNLLLLYFLGRAWFGRGAGLAAATLGAFFWSSIYFEGELNSPALEVFLYLAMAAALWKWFTSGRWHWALVAGALLGLHALVRPNVLLPGVFAAGWMVWTGRLAMKRMAPHVIASEAKQSPDTQIKQRELAADRRLLRCARNDGVGFGVRRGIVHAAVFLLAAAVIISPALVRNYRVAHEFVLISYYGGVNAYIGNNPHARGDSPKMADLRELTGRGEWNCFNYPQVVRGLAEKQGLPDASFSGASRWFYRRVLDFWVADPLAALSLTARKAALFWGPAEVSDSKVIAIERDQSQLLRWLPGFPAALALALLWGLLALARRGGPAAPGTPRFGARDSMALFLALLIMLAGAPAPVMLAVIWGIIARAWLRSAENPPLSSVNPESGLPPQSAPLKTDEEECCLGSRFEDARDKSPNMDVVCACTGVCLNPPSRGVARRAGGCMEPQGQEVHPPTASRRSPPSKGDLRLRGTSACPWTFVPPVFEGGSREAAGDVALDSPTNAQLGECRINPRRSPAVALILALILSHFLSVLPFFIAGRYRLPVAPFLILLGGDALSRLARWAATPGQRRRAVIGATAGLALYGAACMPIASYTPSLSTWHYHRGIALADAGNPGPAVEEFRAAVRADQENAAAWLRLGFACAASGDAAGALDAYTNAVIVAPDNALAHNNLGWELQKAGQPDDARAEYARALKIDPGLEIAAINLAKLLADAGEMGKAVAVYEELLQKNPKAEQARKNLEALKLLWRK